MGGQPSMVVAWRQPRLLKGFVQGIWEQHAGQCPGWRILPSGSVELIFRLGPPFALRAARRIAADAAPIREFCFLSGLHTRPLDITFDRLHVFGVRLHPVAVRALFGLPCAAIRDEAIEGRLVLDDLSRVEDTLQAAPDFEARARAIEHELLTRLAGRRDVSVAERMLRLAEALPADSRASTRAVTAALGYSRSHAHRLCTEWFGQPFTDVRRLARFVGAMGSLHAGGRPLTDIGHQFGYYDQAHFIREFREFSGVTPGEYRRRHGPVPGQLELS